MLTNPWLSLLFSLIFCFALRIWSLKYWPFLAQKLEELGAALGVRGRWVWGQEVVLPDDEAASEQRLISLKREIDLSIFGFAFAPGRSGNLVALYGHLSVTESGHPTECVEDANRHFLQHPPPFPSPCTSPKSRPCAQII